MARKCIVCGNEYSYCRSCPKDAKKETWHALYDNENCKDIAKALTDYNFKLITKDEAKDIVTKCDLSINLSEYYRNTLEVVMAKPKRASKAKAVIIEEIVAEQTSIEDIKEEAKEEEPIGVVITE